MRTLPSAGAAQIVVATDGTMLPHVEFAAGTGDCRKLRKVVWRETRLLAAQASGQTRTDYAIGGGDLAETGAPWLQTVRQAGWASHSYLHAVGDGAEWIARLSETCFGTQGRFLLDLFHVSEYLAAAPPEQPDYLSRQKARLCAGEHPAVIAEPATRCEPATTPDPAAPVWAAHRYLSNRSAVRARLSRRARPLAADRLRPDRKRPPPHPAQTTQNPRGRLAAPQRRSHRPRPRRPRQRRLAQLLVHSQPGTELITPPPHCRRGPRQRATPTDHCRGPELGLGS